MGDLSVSLRGSGEDGAANLGIESCLPLLLPLFRAGVPVWLVGGAVRDALEHRSPRDFDFVAGADVGTLRSLLPQAVPVGGRIPTLVLSRGKGQSPLQLLAGDRGILPDLERRDFSINAMAWLVSGAGLCGEILDPFGGREDLTIGRLRVPLAFRDPFREDPVRVLRLCRFVATRGFTVEPATLSMARRALDDLAGVAGERRLREIGLFWEGEAIGRVLQTLPGDFCGEVLRAGIFGRNLARLPVSWPREALSQAIKAGTGSGLVRLWIFAWEVAGPEGGEERRWGRSLWGERAGVDLPLSRRDRHRLLALDRQRSALRGWIAAGPPSPRDLAGLGRDPFLGEGARLVARDLPEERRDLFFQWVRQRERESQALLAGRLRILPRRRS
ncbi:MAG: hypothetical protein ACP5OP_01880 [Leptospirillia bacterium]